MILNNKMKKITPILIIMSAVLICGCGLPKAKENTAAAIEQIQNYEYEGALMALELAEEAGENQLLIERARGIANLGLTNYEEAVGNFIKALSYSDWKVDALDYDINFYLADTYERMHDYQAAVDTYTSILELKKKDTLAHYRRGTDLLLLGDHDAALADYNTALELEPDNYDLRIEIAGRLSESSYEDEGQEFLKNFLEEKEKKLSDFDKGRIYFYMGDYENAKSFFEEARDDDDQNTVLFLGKTYEMLGDYNYATSTYQNYLTKHPEAAVIYNQLGLARIESQDYEGAREAFSTARSLGNTVIDQTLSYNEIVAYEYTGDFRQAAVLMESYLKKYPDDADAIREYEFLSTR
ncbi:MAG: tetratricopeptide repeat protein [Lachnospiraceae bacterium]|nr:tetratricopeptide repeat protein [Candidatus Colinaster scatohippi]